jgi:hypothetical protein
MNFRYEDQFPSLPDYIVTEIYWLIENPISNHQSSNDVFDYIEQTISSDNSLQLHSIDRELLAELKSFTYNEADSLGYHMDTASDHFSNLAAFDFLPVNSLINDWVNKNITPRPGLVTIQVMHGGSTITPHIDEGRTKVYNYVLETGGGITKFYKNAKDYEHLTAYPQTIFTYDRIEEIETINIEKNRWHYLNVSKIHNVENIQPSQKRISLSLSYV